MGEPELPQLKPVIPTHIDFVLVPTRISPTTPQNGPLDYFRSISDDIEPVLHKKAWRWRKYNAYLIWKYIFMSL